jgi:hypothetical protein
MEYSKIFHVPKPLEKTILSMLKTGIVDVSMLSDEDKMWVLRWGKRLGIITDSHNYGKMTKDIRMHKSTNPSYIILEVFNPDK